MEKKCPVCGIPMKQAVFYKVEVDYCPQCLGIWFDKDELRQAKDEKDKNLNWMDVDLWEESTKFKVSSGKKICPVCGVPLYEVRYGDSDIIVDMCGLCEGIWLDRGEFRKIINYLKTKGRKEIIENYSKVLLKEISDVFSGPETFKEDLGDILTVLKLLQYKFLAQHSNLVSIISSMPFQE